MSKPTSPLLACIDISHDFDYPVIENLSLELHNNQSISIMGASGSGKSTLLHILATLLKPDSGSVTIEGRDIYTLPKSQQLNIRRQEIGFIFQSHYLFRGFNAEENLEISSILSNQEIDKNILRRFEIENILGQNIGTLSGGQQQRLSIARILTKKPKIIFADEPTGNLDKKSAHKIIESIIGYIKSNNAALIIATHDADIAQMCDICYNLKNRTLERWSS